MDYGRPDCSGLTALALRLAKHLAQANAAEGRNLVFSPLSIYAALALIAEGARGDTLRELLDALGADSQVELAALVRGLAERALADRSPSGGPAVAFASGVWHDAAWALQPGFIRAAAASYRAEARAVDFANKPSEAATEINRWVAAATKNLIRSILDDPASVPRDTRLVLANAVYFKGAWEDPFAASRTTEDKFHLLGGGTVTASFMRSGRRQYVAERDGFKVLALRYKSPPSQRTAADCFSAAQHYFMCVVLPDARDGLPELVDRVASTGAGFLRDNLPEQRVSVGELRLPKFKLSFSGSLTSILRDELGINAVFDADRADLSDMANCDSSLPLFVTDIRHKAVIEVNEEGTEAAAVTYGYMVPGCPAILPPRVDFVADHPFMFFVIEEVSGAIVFAGHVLDPSESQ